MARVEADREDLLGEAVAMTRRMEVRFENMDGAVVMGFRPAGWFSIYFGGNLMYQFDSSGQLRRAFQHGLLYRTQGTVLAQLERQRSPTETVLVRRDLTPEFLSVFRNSLHEKLRSLRGQLQANLAQIVRRIPQNDSTLEKDVVRFLDLVLESSQFLAAAIKR